MELRSLPGDFRRACTFDTYKRKTVENWIEREKIFPNLIILCRVPIFNKKSFRWYGNLYLRAIFAEVTDYTHNFNSAIV